MRAAMWALAAAVVGVAIGLVLTRSEFARDNVPVDLTLVSVKPAAGGGKIGPKAVVVNGERHDFGTMDRNGHGTWTFKIRNDGDAPLTLETGKTTCKCTTFAAAKDKVGPGQTEDVVLEWDAKTGDAEFEQSAELITNDPHRNPIQLIVRGRIIDSVRPDRFEVSFFNASANEAATTTLKIHAYRGSELTIESHEFVNKDLAGLFHVSLAPMPSDEVAKEAQATAGVLLTIELKKGAPIGSIDQSLKIVTNQNRESPLTIRILGDVASDISLVGPGQPEKLFIELPTFSRKTGHKQPLFLMVKGPYRDETQLQIQSVEPMAEFSATLGEPNRENPKRVRYPLTIEIPPNATPVSRLSSGAFGRIVIKTTHPDVKELAIRVKYVVPDE